MAKIKRFGILKMASFMGLFSLFFGLISAILLWGLGSLLLSLVMEAVIGPGIRTISVSFSFMNFLWFPLIYGIFGFISGLIFTPIMNFVFKIIGGLNLDIEMQETSKAVPAVPKPVVETPKPKVEIPKI